MNSDKQVIDAYIQSYPADVQKSLEELRQLIQSEAPEATERISYGIPTFYQNGNLVHFAAFKNHIGFYPGASGIRVFAHELAGYVGGKGSVQFPMGQPLPLDLIRRIVQFRLKENLSKSKKAAKGKN